MAVKQSRVTRLSRRITSFLGSNTFFYGTIALFVVQAVWIALSARYPQAFDEQYHFGITKLYTRQLSPFFATQPAGGDVYGALTRDPSYLYHYLLSFPLRLTMHFTGSQAVQVIVLRMIGIALLASSLPVFRKVLRYTGASRALIHTTMFFFVATPVVPLLASQINYDNFIILTTALVLLLYLRFREKLIAQQSPDWLTLGLLVICGVAGSLAKYAFLPVFAVVACFALVDIWRSWCRGRLGLRRPRTIRGWLVAAAVLLAGGLFLQMYGYNMLRYHTPAPDCAKVLSVQRCKVYPPWGRNYMLAHELKRPTDTARLMTYPFVWVYHMMGELVFTISSSFNDQGTVDYFVGTQLIVVEIIAWSIFGVGVLLVLFSGRRLFADPVRRLFAVVALVYVGILFFQNLQDFKDTGYPVGTHGRYLLPLLPLLLVMVGLGVRRSFARLRLSKLAIANSKSALAAVAIAALLFEGGGFVTYIHRSNPSWFWPQSSSAQKANKAAQKLLKPIVIDAKTKKKS